MVFPLYQIQNCSYMVSTVSGFFLTVACTGVFCNFHSNNLIIESILRAYNTCRCSVLNDITVFFMYYEV